MNIWNILARAANKFGDNTCIETQETRLSYSDVEARAMALASYLAGAGVKPGNRVAIVERNSVAFFVSYYAAAALGAVLVPVNHRLTGGEIAVILADSGCRVVISNTEFYENVSKAIGRLSRKQPTEMIWITVGAAPGVRYDDVLSANEGRRISPVTRGDDAVAHLYYTSGTTGRPKGVMLTEKNVCVHSSWAVDELELTGEDVWAHVAPMFHLADAWAVFAITMVGGKHVMMERFDGDEAVELFGSHRVTISNLIPTMLNTMSLSASIEQTDLSSLRVLLSGGAPIAPRVVSRVMDRFGCDYIQTYGMTETSPYLTVSVLPPNLERLPSAQKLALKARTGRPFGKIELKVVDENGTRVLADDTTVGEIWVRGATVTPGYWKRDEETRAAFCGDWLKTGDLAVVDANGFVNIVDRKKDMIITGGENVYSTEVENVLYEHPGIAEAAVFPLPDEKWGEIVCAALVPRQGVEMELSSLESLCRSRLAGYKLPRRFFVLKSLPRTGSGKISKRLLRDTLTMEDTE